MKRIILNKYRKIICIFIFTLHVYDDNVKLEVCYVLVIDDLPTSSGKHTTTLTSSVVED